MFYPAYIHKDPDSAWGVCFPDFPGCYSAADTLDDLPRMAQEAVEVHFHGESFPVPPPSAPEQWADDARYQDGYWMLIDIDLSKIRSKAVRVNITLPESLVHDIDAFAKSHHLSRSSFLAQAAMQAMAQE
jgi:predicted RNase H-like HicB family nuclease